MLNEKAERWKKKDENKIIAGNDPTSVKYTAKVSETILVKKIFLTLYTAKKINKEK